MVVRWFEMLLETCSCINIVSKFYFKSKEGIRWTISPVAYVLTNSGLRQPYFWNSFKVCITMAKYVNDRMTIEIRGDKVIRATALFIEKIILEVAFTTYVEYFSMKKFNVNLKQTCRQKRTLSYSVSCNLDTPCAF